MTNKEIVFVSLYFFILIALPVDSYGVHPIPYPFYPFDANYYQVDPMMRSNIAYADYDALDSRAGPIQNAIVGLCTNIFKAWANPISICPAPVECPSCYQQSCETCSPVPPPATDTITSCDSIAVALSGTIKFPTAFPSGSNACNIILATFSPYTTFKLTCTDLAGGLIVYFKSTGTFTPNDDTLQINTPYTLTGSNYASLVFLDGGTNKPACTWTISK